jgi:hypothetical protein
MAHLAGQTGKYISLKESVKISWWLDTVPGLIYSGIMDPVIIAAGLIICIVELYIRFYL